MAYTYEQLTKAYAAVHGGVEPTGEAASQLRLLTNASFTDTQRLAYILNTADQSTAVAVLSYQFFTGKAPSAEGMAYLVNSPDNATDLNDPIYAKFNLENRFMNFATNLALNGEGKAAFETKYGAMTYAAYVAEIYESIIGKAHAEAAGLNAEQTIQSIIARQDLILQSARNNGVIGPNATQAEIDLALKAATAAYLLAEGIKADIGAYAGATNNFMVGMATGEAKYGTDILATHPATPGSNSSGVGQTIDTPPPLPGAPEPEGPSAQTFTLTLDDDKFTGGALDDTFNATDLTFSRHDILDGGDGHDTFNLTVTPGAGNTFGMPNASVSNIETLNITSDGGVAAYASIFTGLKEMNVTAGRGDTELGGNTDTDIDLTVTDQASGLIEIYDARNVTVSTTLASAGMEVGVNGEITGDIVIESHILSNALASPIKVVGGKTVSITQTAEPTSGSQRNSAVTVNGSELTTEVTVKMAKAVANDGNGNLRGANTVTISDANYASTTLAGTITKVSLDSYTTAQIDSSALTDLSLAHGSGNVALRSGSLALSTTATLNLALDGLTGGIVGSSGNTAYGTLNITTGATASTLANIGFSSVTDLNLDGDSRLTVTSFPALNSLETLKINGAAGLTANLGDSSVTLVDASGTTGSNTLTINAHLARFIGGAGADLITMKYDLIAKDIELGDGDDSLILVAGTRPANVTAAVVDGGAGVDTLQLDAADAARQWLGKFTNFDTIVLRDAATPMGFGLTIDLGDLAAGATTVRTEAGYDLHLDGLDALETLELTGAGTFYTLSASNWGGTDDSLDVKLLNGAGADLNFALSGITANGIEIVNITSDDTRTSPDGSFSNQLLWLGNDVKSVTITGDAGLTLTATSNALTTVDASGLTAGGFEWTAGALTGAATVKGSAMGTNTVDLSGISMTGSFSYTGGTGADHVTVVHGANTINVVSDSAVDTVVVAGANTATAFTTISGLGAGDKILFDDFGTMLPMNMIALSGHSTLADYLAAGSVNSDGFITSVEYFVVGSDTYLLYDRSFMSGFQDGTDVLIKLVGVTGVPSFSSGTLTL